MAQNFFSGMFQPVVLDDNGAITVAAGYKAKFYAAGTDIPKTIYTDPSNATAYSSPSNIAFLDDTGKALIYLGVGGYKLVLTDPYDTPVPGYTIDNILGEGAFGTGFVDSFADLVNVNTDIFPYTYIGGYYAPGDGGGGMFYNETSSDSPDGGYIQESDFDPTKRWFRVPDESNKVRSASFGAIGLSTNKTDNMLAADSYALTNGLTLLINVATRINTMTFTAPSVEFAEGAFIRGWTAAVATFNGIVSGPYSTIFSRTVGPGLSVVFANESQESNPYWFEGSPDNSGALNLAAFTEWTNAGAGVFILPAGNWTYTGTFPVLANPTTFYGTINNERQGVQFADADSSARFGRFIASGNSKFIEADGADGLETDGDWSVAGNNDIGGNQTVGGTIDADGNITSDGTVRGAAFDNGVVGAGAFEVDNGGNLTAASITSATYVQAKAGSGATNYQASGNILRVLGSGTLSILANTLTATGSYLKIIMAGSTDDSTPVIAATVGGSTVFSVGLTASGSSPYNYHAEILLFRTGATTSYSTGFAVVESNTGTDVTSTADSRTAAITWANANTVANASSATNTQGVLLCEIYPVES